MTAAANSSTITIVLAVVVPIFCVILASLLAAIGWLLRELLKSHRDTNRKLTLLSSSGLALAQDVRRLKTMHQNHPNGHVRVDL